MKYDRLGTSIFDHQLRFENWANMRHVDSVIVRGLSCGRVDIMNLSCVGRMTADDARELAAALIEAASAAIERRKNIDLDDAEHRVEMDRI